MGRIRRHKRIRKKIKGTADKLRLCVFRSNKYIYAQLINDDRGEVLVSADDRGFSKNKTEKGKKQRGEKVGELIAKKAKEKGIKTVVFDRGGYKYHGRVKALAEGARKGGLKI